MMKDFKQNAEQLKELAKVLNEFKSEVVQVKLLELLFQEGFAAAAPVEAVKTETKPAIATPVAPEPVAPATEEKPRIKAPAKPTANKPARPAKQKAVPATKITRKRSTTRPGPSIILKQLIESNFFNDSRTIGDVVDYCMKMYNYEYKSTDLSGTLAKLAKDGVLNRVKNPKSNQFEYTMV